MARIAFVWFLYFKIFFRQPLITPRTALHFRRNSCISDFPSLLKRNRNLILPNIAILLGTLLTAGCGAIFYSSQQELKVQPAGVKLEVYTWDGSLVASPKNESSSKVKVNRPIEPSYLIRVHKEGYCPRYWLTKREASGPLVFFDQIMAISSPPFGFFIFGLPYKITNNAWAFTPDEYDLTTPDTKQCGP